jgi:hypothetical protein
MIRAAPRIRSATIASVHYAKRSTPSRMAWWQVFSITAMRRWKTIAEAKVRHAAAQLDHYQDLVKAIEAEITHAQGDVRLRATDLHSTFAAVVCNSPAFKHLCADLNAARMRLRTLRTVFEQVQTACHGAMSNDVARANAHQPVEERIGHPVNVEMVQTWWEALQRLADDPDAELPE